MLYHGLGGVWPLHYEDLALVYAQKSLAAYQQTYVVRQTAIVDPVILAFVISILDSPDRSLRQYRNRDALCGCIA